MKKIRQLKWIMLILLLASAFSVNANDEIILRLFGIDGKLYAGRNAALQAGINNISLDNLT
jgi:hypothetical protein